MRTSKMLVSLVVMFAVVAGIFLASGVSASDGFADITDITVNGVSHYSGNDVISAVAGETIPVTVTFQGNLDNESYERDVRVIARLLGGSTVSASTTRFDVLGTNTYSRTVSIELPFDIDPSESYTLEISVESPTGLGERKDISLEIQRDSYLVEFLSVSASQEVVAGQTLAIDAVLKNRGRQFATDTFVQAEIPELGISAKAYYGDLSPEDQGGNVVDKQDAEERTIYLRIPSTAKAGVYNIQLTAYNGDSITSTVKRVVVTPAGGSSVVTPVDTQRFAPGQEATYSMTLVNAGNQIQVYNIVVENSNGLNIRTSDPVVVIPAGSSKTIQLTASADNVGDYSFTVNVHSDGNLIQTQTFMAKVEGSSVNASSAAVVLTIVLAIIFVVLVVVLIVLLTRKPEKKNEDFGESYY